MLKFSQIRFENFLVYHDAVVDFSTDGRVTVLRAENGSGKTTFLRAMEWAIYGDSALPNTTKYRLHPPDHRMPEDGPVTIAVELDVILEEDGKPRQATIRRSTEVVPTDDGWKRSLSDAEFRWEDGTEGDEEELETRLPWRLREFFFTDGDKATDYVGGVDEAERVSKSSRQQQSLRSNVTEAIKSLLGLDLLEAVNRKASGKSRELDQELAKSSGSQALSEARECRDKAHEHLDRLKADAKNKEGVRRRIEGEITDLEAKRDELLRTGDPSELQKQVALAETSIRKNREKLLVAQRDEAATLRSAHFTFTAGANVFRDYVDRAQPLVNSGVVPATYIWWVRRRLEQGVCMCGCGLDPQGSAADQDRHEAVATLIEESEQETKAANHAGDLYYHLAAQLELLSHESWLEQLATIRRQQGEAQDAIAQAESILSETEPKLEALAGSPIETLRRQIQTHLKKDRELERTIGSLHNEIKTSMDDAVTADRRLEAARRRAHAAGDLSIKSALYQDALEVLKRAQLTRTRDDVESLSTRMNEMFKQMIGQHEIIDEVKVTRSDADVYEVLGIGIDGERMDVAHQFNGASKRALTNSFVLALGETAGVEAPNVIDTPLGMMDPSVRRNVFDVMAKECAQLVLLLTRSEIAGIEEQLDASAHVVTVTNQGSGDVVNRKYEDTRSVVCACDHRQYCETCERLGDELGPLERRSA